MAVLKAKVPAVIATGIICLCLGAGAGALTMSYVAGKPEQQANASTGADESKEGAKDTKEAPKTKGDGKNQGKNQGRNQGKNQGRTEGKNPPAPTPPSSKMQLAQFVNKLDVLTRTPLKIELTAEQKKQIKDLLAEIETKDELSDDEAKAKLEALLKIVDEKRATLEAAGFQWPGASGGGGMNMGTPPANPFKSGDAAEQLKSLLTTLGQ